MKQKLIKLSFFGLALTVSSAFATTLNPGQTLTPPDVFTTTTGYTTLATVSGNINPLPGTSFNATYTETAVRDANNVYGAGDITFLISFTNAGPGIVERLSTSTFDSFLTDAGYNSGMSTAGAIAPTSVDRSANGGVVGFNFIPPGSNVSTGQGSVMLEIMTNAPNFTAGFVSIQDGQSGFNNGFQPAGTPEPVSMSLIGGGLALLGLARWRRPSKKL